MVSTFTTSKRLEQPDNGDYVDSWDTPVNADWAHIDTALGGVAVLNLTGLSGSRPLVIAEYRPLKIHFSGIPAGPITMVVPTGVGGLWVVRNDTTGEHNIAVSLSSGGAPGQIVIVPPGTNTLVTCDGSSAGMRVAITTTPSAAGLPGQIQFNIGGLLAASGNMFWDGTTFVATGLAVIGETQLGDLVGHTVNFKAGQAMTPNGLNFNANHFVLSDPDTSKQVAIRTPLPSPANTDTLSVGGVIRLVNDGITPGGVRFPDNTFQGTAAPSGDVLGVLTQNYPCLATGVMTAGGPTTGPIGAAGESQRWLITGMFLMSHQVAGVIYFLQGRLMNMTDSVLVGQTTISTQAGINTSGTVSRIVSFVGVKTFDLRGVNTQAGAGELLLESTISAVRLA